MGLSFHKLVTYFSGSPKLNGIAMMASFLPECNGEMSFASARVSDKHDVLCLFDVLTTSQLKQFGLIEGRNRREFKLIERFHVREFGVLDATRDLVSIP
ncbi:hypothetical protein GCM10023228_25350 [Brevibacillus fulvus]